MLSKTALIIQLNILSGGDINILIALDIVDGDERLSRNLHRLALPPGADIDEQMAFVNTDLQAKGWPAVTDLQALRDHAAVAWTPTVVDTYQARMAAAEKSA